MSKINPSVQKLESLKSRYISGASALLVICMLLSWVAFTNVSSLLGSVTSHSKYQLQLSSDLSELSESLYNIEKLLKYYSQLSNDIVYKQLQDNIDRAETALHNIEYSHWVVNKSQKGSISELRDYVLTYKFHINWLVDSSKLTDKNTKKYQENIDVFAKNVRPVTVKVWGTVKVLEEELKTLSVIENSRLDDVQNAIQLMLWFGLLMLAGFLLANFAAIKRWVLNPLSILSDEIKDINNFSEHSNLNILEIRGLLDAMQTRCAKNTEREKQLEFQILHDPLTGLPNRTMLRNELELAIDNTDSSGVSFTLLMIDLDRFKDINDTLGHHVGDSVLCEISERFNAVLSEQDMIARLGGDEFAVLLYNTDIEKARTTAQTLLKCFKTDLFLEGHRFNIGGSIGMAVYPAHAKNEQELLQRADIAMYFAKRKNFGYAIYDKSEDKHDIRQLGFEVELREAIEKDDLTLHYQPKIDVKSKQVVSTEVLLRWNHAEHGYIPAEEISLLAEKTGLITDLSKWVVKNAVSQLALWIKKGIGLPISINLSVWNLQDPDFFDFVEKTLTASDVPADMITFEITESAVMSDTESALKTLQQISGLGANISIDDYGTGFSSLQYLKILPVNEIKIDKSFVTDMINYENDAVIVRSIIDLSHNLGLTVVAEGVETQDVYDILEILRCDVIQGYHISRPISSEKLENWLDSHRNNGQISKTDNVTYLFH